MGMYSVAIEFTIGEQQKEGEVFFEADSPEQAKAEAPQAVQAVVLSGENLTIHEPKKFEPASFVMWDKSEIEALRAPNLLKLQRFKQVSIPTPPSTVN
jgi:hypothetical protein